MKMSSTRKMLLGVGLVIAALAVSACIDTIHGGGVVSLSFVETGSGPGVLADANVAVSVTCNDRKDAVLSTFHWTDNANGVNFTAHLPWTPLSEIFLLIPPGEPVPATCAEAAAVVSEIGFSTSVGLINSQGQTTGAAQISVAAPEFDCGAGQQGVVIVAEGSDLPGGSYFAGGCLDRGKIVFQNL